ncbi:MAG TPA: hypothetical protein VGI08_11055, partial [Diaminobutyricibacter sp.]
MTREVGGHFVDRDDTDYSGGLVSGSIDIGHLGATLVGWRPLDKLRLVGDATNALCSLRAASHGITSAQST